MLVTGRLRAVTRKGRDKYLAILRDYIWIQYPNTGGLNTYPYYLGGPHHTSIVVKAPMLDFPVV